MSTEARMYCRMRWDSSWGPVRSVPRARRRRTCAASGVDNVIIPTNRADVCATVGCGGGGRLAASQFFDLASARARAEQQAEGGGAANSTRIAHDNERVDHWVADAHRPGHEGQRRARSTRSNRRARRTRLRPLHNIQEWRTLSSSICARTWASQASVAAIATVRDV